MINANINGSVILEDPLRDIVRYPGAYLELTIDNSLEIVTDTRPTAMLLGVAALTGNGQSDDDYAMSDIFAPDEDYNISTKARESASKPSSEDVVDEKSEMLRKLTLEALSKSSKKALWLGFAALEIDAKTKVSAFVASSFRQGLRSTVENVSWRYSRMGAEDQNPEETKLRTFVHKGIEQAQPANFPQLHTDQKIELFTDRIVLPQAFKMFAPRVALMETVATRLIDLHQQAA